MFVLLVEYLALLYIENKSPLVLAKRRCPVGPFAEFKKLLACSKFGLKAKKVLVTLETEVNVTPVAFLTRVRPLLELKEPVLSKLKIALRKSCIRNEYTSVFTKELLY